MYKKENLHSCNENKEAKCRKETCKNSEFDPRSFCHNICAKPNHVCAEKTCEKFISEESNEKKIVCIPRRKCKIISRFRPDDETNLDGAESEIITSSIKSDQPEQSNQIEIEFGEVQKRETREDAKDKTSRKENKVLTETLQPEDIAAVYALLGSDICPCCSCKICDCALRKVESEKSVKSSIKSTDEKEEDFQYVDENLPEKEKLSIVEEKHEVLKVEALQAVQSTKEDLDSIEKEAPEQKDVEMLQKEMMKTSEIENEETASSYGYSFDYFHKPDLEAFEAEKRIKQEMEIQNEIEREKIAKQAEEERIRKEKEKSSAVAMVEEEVQAQPEAQEQESQFYGKEQRRDLIDEFSTVPAISDKIDEWALRSDEDEAWAQYKVAEWAGIRHQDIPSVIEQKAGEVIEKSSAQLETTNLSEHSMQSLPLSQQSATQKSPQIDLQLNAFDKSWLDDQERISFVPPPLPSQKAEQEDASPKIKKLTDEFGPVLRSSTSDIKPEMIPLMALKTKKTPETMESIQEKSMQSAVESEVSASPTGDHADFLVKKRKKYLTDICNCLPGYCKCGTHFTFKKEVDTDEFGMGFKALQLDKTVQTTMEEKKLLKKSSLGGASENSDSSSCSCIHSDEQTLVTPVISEVELVASHPTPIIPPKVKSRPKCFIRCIQPKFQKSLVIVKPQAVQYKDVIFRAVKMEGLDIVEERLIQLTPEQVAEIYVENFGSAYFPLFVQQLSSSPVLVFVIAGLNAIQRWQAVVGPERRIPVSWFYPTSMKQRFSVNEDILDVMKISDEFQKAKIEIKYFFPLHIIDPIIISSTMIQDYCDEFIHPTLLKGLFKLVKTKPIDPIGFLAEWLLVNNPFQPFYKQKEVALAPT